MIELIIAALILGYREVQILIDRGSWEAYKFFEVFWYTDQNDEKKKNKDSFHIANGIATYLIIRAVNLPNFLEMIYPLFCPLWITKIVSDFIYWLIWFYIRNIPMHILLRRKGYREWWYIIPLIGKLLKPLFTKTKSIK